MSKIWVTGAADTADLKCEVCGEWITHWKKLAGLEEGDNVFCCHPEHKRQGNLRLADRGAHVIKRFAPEGKKDPSLEWNDFSDIADETLFIIPVCKHHNITDEQSILINKDLLVSADPCEDD
jgi:hypothetical protein